MNKRFYFDEQYSNIADAIIGTDEAGRGPGAGPVFAGAVCFINLDKNIKNELDILNDSKKLTQNQRELLYDIITKNSIWSVAQGSVQEIEQLNILKASLLTMKRCVQEVITKLQANHKSEIIVLVDGNKKIIDFNYNQTAIIKGDSKSAAIAAASIIAKVSRDRFMLELNKEFPFYGWNNNKGYLTRQHLNAIDKYGTCTWHRKSFLVKHFNKKNNQLQLLID